MKRLTQKQIEEKYDCTCFKDTGFDDGHTFWVAYPKNEDTAKFTYADGWTLVELVENIENDLFEESYEKQVNDDYMAHMDIRE